MLKWADIVKKIRALIEPEKESLDFKKARIYVESFKDVPKEYTALRGPRGGVYYETKITEREFEFPDTKEKRQALVNSSTEQKAMEIFLKGIRSGKSIDPTLTGLLKDKWHKVSKYSTEHLDRYSDYIDGKTFSLTNRVITNQLSLLNETTDISAHNAFRLSKDSIDKLIYQEMRSWERQLGDHGVRHIEGNLRIFNQIAEEFNAAGGNISVKDSLLTYITMINHDLGYTTEPSRTSIEGTKYHHEFGEKLFEDQRDFFESFLSSEEYLRIKNYILYHDTPNLDWEKSPLLSAISISDNLALFHKEKLPKIFEAVPHSLSYLIKMQRALNAKDMPRFNVLRDKLEVQINKTNLPDYTKYLLKKASREVSPYTPKVTLSMLAGEIGKVVYSRIKGLDVTINYNDFESKLSKLYDQGQKKFVKLAEAFGITDFDTNKFEFIKDDKQILSVHIGQELKAIIDQSVKKHFDSKLSPDGFIYKKKVEMKYEIPEYIKT